MGGPRQAGGVCRAGASFRCLRMLLPACLLSAGPEVINMVHVKDVGNATKAALQAAAAAAARPPRGPFRVVRWHHVSTGAALELPIPLNVFDKQRGAVWAKWRQRAWRGLYSMSCQLGEPQEPPACWDADGKPRWDDLEEQNAALDMFPFCIPQKCRAQMLGLGTIERLKATVLSKRTSSQAGMEAAQQALKKPRQPHKSEGPAARQQPAKPQSAAGPAAAGVGGGALAGEGAAARVSVGGQQKQWRQRSPQRAAQRQRPKQAAQPPLGAAQKKQRQQLVGAAPQQHKQGRQTKRAGRQRQRLGPQAGSNAQKQHQRELLAGPGAQQRKEGSARPLPSKPKQSEGEPEQPTSQAPPQPQQPPGPLHPLPRLQRLAWPPPPQQLSPPHTVPAHAEQQPQMRQSADQAAKHGLALCTSQQQQQQQQQHLALPTAAQQPGLHAADSLPPPQVTTPLRSSPALGAGCALACGTPRPASRVDGGTAVQGSPTFCYAVPSTAAALAEPDFDLLGLAPAVQGCRGSVLVSPDGMVSSPPARRTSQLRQRLKPRSREPGPAHPAARQPLPQHGGAPGQRSGHRTMAQRQLGRPGCVGQPPPPAHLASAAAAQPRKHRALRRLQRLCTARRSGAERGAAQHRPRRCHAAVRRAHPAFFLRCLPSTAHCCRRRCPPGGSWRCCPSSNRSGAHGKRHGALLGPGASSGAASATTCSVCGATTAAPRPGV
ncbi:hypothetical protein ABPG75_006991 [Micractinium tetrahymenae]